MFSLRNLFGREDKLLCLLEASAREAQASVQTLVRVCREGEAPALRDDAAFSRIKERKITQEISREVYTTFIAALDREDIERLSNALYRVAKGADKFGERLRGSPEFARRMDFGMPLSVLAQAAEVVVELVRCCQGGLVLEKVKALTDSLEALGEKAGEQIRSLYRELYSGKYPAMEVLVLKDLCELLEKLGERCRDVGEIVAHITLKHS